MPNSSPPPDAPDSGDGQESAGREFESSRDNASSARKKALGDDSSSHAGGPVTEGGAQRDTPPDIPGATASIIPERDRVRRWLALGLMAILAATIVGGLTLFALKRVLDLQTEDIRTIVEIFFPSLVTLVGTITGFYFGSEKGREED